MLNFYSIKRWFYIRRTRIFTTSINRAIYSNNVKKLEAFLITKKDIDRADKFSLTPLLVAAYTGNLRMLKMLIDAGADYRIKTFDGENLLMLSVCTPTSKFDVVEYLLKLNLFDINEADNSGATPLLSACNVCNVEIVNLLIKNGANINCKANNAWELTPLLSATIHGGPIEVVKLLLNNHAEVNVKDNKVGMTPLMQAACRGYFEIVKELVEHGADLTPKDYKGRTALDWAELTFRKRIANYLKERISEIQSSISEKQSDNFEGETGKDVAHKSIEELTIDEINGINKPAKNIFNNLAMLFFSLMLFAGLGLFTWKPIDLFILIIVLFVHELGHLLFMKIFKYRDVKMFFIPMFGAATSGIDFQSNGTKQAIVSLAGPLPGIFIGFILSLVFVSTKNTFYYQASLFFVTLNMLNLLPLYPLDGGRFFEAVLFSRNPVVEIVFKLLTTTLIGIFAFVSHTWILFIIPVLTLLTLKTDYRIANTAKNIHAEIAQGTLLNFILSKESFEVIKEKLDSKIFSVNKTPKDKITILSRVWQRIHFIPPRLLMSIFLFSIYGVSLLFAISTHWEIIYSKVNLGIEHRIVTIMKADSSRVSEEIVMTNGKLQSKGEIDSLNRYNGEFVYYYPNGNISETGKFSHGKWDSTWLDFNQNGDTTLIRHFNNGKFLYEMKKEKGNWIDLCYDDLSTIEKNELERHNKSKGVFAISRKWHITNNIIDFFRAYCH